MMKRHRLLWLVTLLSILTGGLLCKATGRTLGHAFTVAAAAIFGSSAMYIADVYAPSGYGRRVRGVTGVLALATFAALMGFYAWQMYAAQYVYVFDNSQYYYQQLILSANMPYGLKQVLDLLGRTISGNDYTYVLNLFVAPLFSLTDRTIQAFTLCATAMTWGPLLYQLRKMVLRLAEKLGFSPCRAVLLHGAMCLCVCAFPLMHAAAARGQINLLAMVFFLEVVQLSWGDASWDVPLRRVDWRRRVALFLAVVMLVISRRWCIFLLAGYLLVWAAGTAIRLIRGRCWRGLVHFTVYGTACTVLGLAVLADFFRYALQGNYTTAYAYWNLGGLPYELANQAGYVGVVWLAVMLAGYLWGMCQQRWHGLRSLSVAMLLATGLAMLFFTRIQNMHHHQSVILVPGYVFGLLLAFAGVLSLTRRAVRAGLAGALTVAMLGQYGLCVTSASPARFGRLTSNVSLKPPYRPDMAQVVELSDFVHEHCSETEKAFFLCDNSWYNRTTFTNIRYPDMTARKKVVIEHYANASHGFPVGWFTAGYYMVPSTCQSDRADGTIERLRRFLREDVPERFEVIETIDFGAFDMDIMRRVGTIQADEVDALLTLFAKECRQYPTLFTQRIEAFRPDGT